MGYGRRGLGDTFPEPLVIHRLRHRRWSRVTGFPATPGSRYKTTNRPYTREAPAASTATLLAAMLSCTERSLLTDATSI